MPSLSYLTTQGEDALIARARQLLHESSGLYLTDATRAVQVAREVFEIASMRENRPLMGRSLMELGRGLRARADLTGALNSFQQALAIFTEIQDQEYIAKALQAVGTIYSASGELEQAAKCFDRALPIARELSDRYTIQRILNSWGIVYVRIGNYAEALKCFQECLASLDTYPDLYLESSVLLNLGAIFQRSADYTVAMDYFQRSLTIGRELNDYHHICSALIFLGDTMVAERKYSEASNYLQEVLSISDEHEYRDTKAHALKSLGDVAAASGQYEEALNHLTAARELVVNTPNRLYLQKIDQELGANYLKLGRMREAEISLNRALELAESIGSPQLLYETNVLLSEFRVKNMEYNLANMHLHAALKQHEVLFSESNEHALRDMEVRMAIEAGLREQALERKLTEELDRINQKLRETSGRQAEIFQVAGQDVRSPITNIIELANHLHTDKTLAKEDVSKISGLIEQSGEYLLNLMEQLLASARSEEGPIKLGDRPVQMGKRDERR
jgi:tetratricopeptide (TPR) repeat protein